MMMKEFEHKILRKTFTETDFYEFVINWTCGHNVKQWWIDNVNGMIHIYRMIEINGKIQCFITLECIARPILPMCKKCYLLNHDNNTKCQCGENLIMTTDKCLDVLTLPFIAN